MEQDGARWSKIQRGRGYSLFIAHPSVLRCLKIVKNLLPVPASLVCLCACVCVFACVCVCVCVCLSAYLYACLPVRPSVCPSSSTAPLHPLPRALARSGQQRGRSFRHRFLLPASSPVPSPSPPKVARPRPRLRAPRRHLPLAPTARRLPRRQGT